MIARTRSQWQPGDWREELARGFGNPAELLAALGIAPERIGDEVVRDRAFPLRVPQSYARRMTPGDPHDPLLRQVLPIAAEQLTVPGYATDPVGDHAALRGPGVLRKYRGRVLLITTGACAIHCRYCFRRHFPYSESHAGAARWAPALRQIADDPSIREVILSGGDPLVLDNERLAELIERLDAVPHLKHLRIHTRLPIVLPSRIDDDLLHVLMRGRLTVVMIVHANHAREIDPEVEHALTRLAEAGIALFNQSVLLRGINDDDAALIELSERLFAARVTPYYLHLLDKVQGAAHFAVDEALARDLHRALRAHLPGYLVPRLVREVAGEASKVPL